MMHTYDSQNRITQEVYSEYTGTFEGDESAITITPRTKTTYVYNSYGLLTNTTVRTVEKSGTSLADTVPANVISTDKTYNTAAGSRIFGSLATETDTLGQITRYFYDNSNPVIYAFSLKDNIKLYKEVSDKEIYDVIESLELTPIITKSGADINSDVTKEFSEDGLELSGGEMQKIGLARTHVGDFGLLLLDEPSSMLDPLAEAKLNDIIWSLDNKATTIVISHRLSSVVGADEIYFMKKGEIVERGTHNELMNKRGLYYTMFETQAKNYRT